jgi:hypothetical protein
MSSVSTAKIIAPNAGVKRHLDRAQHVTRPGTSWVRPKCPLERLVRPRAGNLALGDRAGREVGAGGRDVVNPANKVGG